MDCKTTEEAQPHANMLRIARWLKSEHERIWCWAELTSFRQLPLRTDEFDVAGIDEVPIDALPWSEPHLISGHNPDRILHMVVGVDGKMVWDPNPLRRGVTDIDGFGFLIPLETLPRAMHTWPGVALYFD